MPAKYLSGFRPSFKNNVDLNNKHTSLRSTTSLEIGLITISTAFHEMKIPSNDPVSQNSQEGFRQFKFWKQNILDLCPSDFHRSATKNAIYFEEVESLSDGKEKSRLALNFFSKSVILRYQYPVESKTLKADKPNLYLHALLSYYILSHYLSIFLYLSEMVPFQSVFVTKSCTLYDRCKKNLPTRKMTGYYANSSTVPTLIH
jgi:hypothetical protein